MSDGALIVVINSKWLRADLSSDTIH